MKSCAIGPMCRIDASWAFQFHVASSVLIVLILIDMIWKPGA